MQNRYPQEMRPPFGEISDPPEREQALRRDIVKREILSLYVEYDQEIDDEMVGYKVSLFLRDFPFIPTLDIRECFLIARQNLPVNHRLRPAHIIQANRILQSRRAEQARAIESRERREFYRSNKPTGGWREAIKEAASDGNEFAKAYLAKNEG